VKKEPSTMKKYLCIYNERSAARGASTSTATIQLSVTYKFRFH